MPHLSVVIPAHNAAATLAACLDSVLAQSLPSLEVLCVDDASTDSTAHMLRQYAAADGRIRILTHARNKGVSAARNSGLAVARGDFVAFVDSDDWLKNDFCQRLYAAAKRSDADIAKGNYAYAHHNNIDYSINERIRQDKHNFYIQFCAAIYKRELLRKYGIIFPEILHASEDIVFACTAARHADAIAIDDQAHIVVRTRPGSATFSVPDHAALISHYRALSLVAAAAMRDTMHASSYNHVLASLLGLVLRMAARNRQAGVRRFVIAKTLQLYKKIQAYPAWDRRLFALSLQDEGANLPRCLECGDLQGFFARMDKIQAQRCRMLRSQTP